jgi:hypothetical protein
MAKGKKLRLGWKPVRLTKAEKAALKRVEREQEIYAKAPEELTESEWKWLRDVMDKIHHKSPQGRKKEEKYDDWMHQIARAKLRGKRPPELGELAGIMPPGTRDGDQTSAYKDKMDRIRDAFKKAKKGRQIPAPPKR